MISQPHWSKFRLNYPKRNVSIIAQNSTQIITQYNTMTNSVLKNFGNMPRINKNQIIIYILVAVWFIKMNGNVPSVLSKAMGMEKKPFTYLPGGIDFSELKSPKMQKRINKHMQGGNGQTDQSVMITYKAFKKSYRGPKLTRFSLPRIPLHAIWSYKKWC